MKRRQIDKLTLQITELDQARRARALVVDEGMLTEAERAFVSMADARGKRVLRNGWPDFMVFDLESGGMIAVEVKTDDDSVSPAQARMFEALEEHGLRVMVWSPERPAKLIPWRRHELEKKKQRGRQGEWLIGPRQPRLPRARTTRRADR